MQNTVSIVIPTYNRKQKLYNLIESILNSTYKNIEVIIIDDNSDYNINEFISKSFDTKGQIIKVFSNETKSYVTKSRNKGLVIASGEYIFLVDDDNILDKNCIEYLARFLTENPSTIMVGPVMYYYKEPDRIFWAGTKRNMTTSRTKFVGTTLPMLEGKSWETDDFPNAWMFRRAVIDSGIFFDENLVMHYEESDFAYKVRSTFQKKFHVVSQAKLWHDIDKENANDLRRRWLDLRRLYFTGKNRIVFHKRYSTKAQYIIFLCFWNWIFVSYYIFYILFKLPINLPNEKLLIIKTYLKGVISGITS